MKKPLVKLSQSGGIATITFNRPEAANAVNTEFAKLFAAAVKQVSEDCSLRALLIQAEGPVFCAGGDLKGFHAAGDNIKEQLAEMIDLMHAASELLYALPVPVVASVNGSAGGIGLSLLCACDFVIASDTAKFALGYLAAGLTPDGGSTYFLPRLIGPRRALDLMLLNRALDAHEACDWGLINWAVSADDLSIKTEKLIARLSQGPTSAFGAAKHLVQSSFDQSLKDQLDSEKSAILASAVSRNGREGIAAFTEKRRAKFAAADIV